MNSQKAHYNDRAIVHRVTGAYTTTEQYSELQCEHTQND